MQENFKKIKTKFILETILKSLFVGLFLGVLVSSILILTYKQLGLTYKLWLFILIGVLVFLVVGISLFFIFKPNDIKVAKRIDSELHLKEKVHTMIEYEGKSGYLVERQREDASAKLKEIKPKKLKMHFNWYLLLFPLLAIPFFVSSIVVKANVIEERPPVEKPISGDPYIILQIRDLIREVNEDESLMSGVKEAYTSHLEDLIEAIDTPDLTRTSEVAAVNQTITDISYSSINLNTIDDISSVLANSNNNNVHDLGVALATYDEGQITSALEALKSTMITPSPSTSRRNYEQLVTDLYQLVDNERLPLDDEMYSLFTSSKEEIAGILNTANFNTGLNEYFVSLEKDFSTAVTRQAETIVMANYLEERLVAIFELPSSDTPVNPPIPDGPSGSGDEDPSNPDNDGGGGHGDTIYAGDDILYDPDEGLVPYYEVIAKYSAYIDGLVQDGVISEELANYYIEYFNNLYQAEKD